MHMMGRDMDAFRDGVDVLMDAPLGGLDAARYVSHIVHRISYTVHRGRRTKHGQRAAGKSQTERDGTDDRPGAASSGI